TSATQAAAIGTSGSPATGTIQNDDSATVTITAPTITETNMDQDVVFTVVLEHAVAEGFDVAINAANGTAVAADFALVTSTLHFNGTVNESHDVHVTIRGETLVEDNETFTVSLGPVSGTLATQAAAIATSGSPATGTIQN